MDEARRWSVEPRAARARDLCNEWPGAAKRTSRAAALCRVTAAALVIGSTQPLETVDLDSARRSGIEIVRRGVGGGAVLVSPDAQVWIDVWLPRADPLWDDDVVRSAGWLGETWRSALGALGAAPLDVHRGKSLEGPWARLVCFGGLGPGEVTVRGSKLVGLAQRRTRQGARYLTVAHLSFEASAIVELLALDGADRGSAVAEIGRESVGLADVLPARATSSDRRSLIASVERAFIEALP